jgi:hypothetical protein
MQPERLLIFAADVPEDPHAAIFQLASIELATHPEEYTNRKHSTSLKQHRKLPKPHISSRQEIGETRNWRDKKLERLTIFSVCVFVECSVTVQVVVRHSISFLHVLGVLYPPPPFHSVSVALVSAEEVFTTDDDGLLVQRNVVLLVAVAKLKSAGKIHRPRISKASESYAGRASGTRQKLSMLDIHVKGCTSDKMLVVCKDVARLRFDKGTKSRAPSYTVRYVVEMLRRKNSRALVHTKKSRLRVTYIP